MADDCMSLTHLLKVGGRNGPDAAPACWQQKMKRQMLGLMNSSTFADPCGSLCVT